MCALQLKYLQRAWEIISDLKHSLGIEISLLRYARPYASVQNEAWKEEHSQMVSISKQRRLILSATGVVLAQVTMQNISLIKFLNQSSKKVSPVSLSQLTEVEGVSNRMEKTRLIRVLNEVKQKNLTVDQLTDIFRSISSDQKIHQRTGRGYQWI